MASIVSLLVIIGLSLMIVRWASVALELTGLGRDAARFQALSAFSGVGFTTSEAESLVDDPVRRRIISWLMMVGSLGAVSAVSAAFLSAVDLRNTDSLGTLALALGAGLGFLFWLGTSQWLDGRICGFMRWAMRRFTSLDERDYTRLLHVGEEYNVTRIRVRNGGALEDSTLAESGLLGGDLVVLGVEHPDGRFSGTPASEMRLAVEDLLVVYGNAGRVEDLIAEHCGARE